MRLHIGMPQAAHPFANALHRGLGAGLVLSEELDELFDLSDRLHVMAKGRLSPSMDRADATVERIGEWMSGLWNVPTAASVQEADHAQA